MSEMYQLEHASCKTEFWPTETVRLYANEDGIERGYRYQDLLIGNCECGEDIFAYVGIDEFKKPIQKHHIGKKQHGTWALRKQTEKVKTRSSRLDPSKYSKDRQETVNGCVYDRRSGKYFFKDAIGVR